jgi:hypothetical protein
MIKILFSRKIKVQKFWQYNGKQAKKNAGTNGQDTGRAGKLKPLKRRAGGGMVRVVVNGKI